MSEVLIGFTSDLQLAEKWLEQRREETKMSDIDIKKFLQEIRRGFIQICAPILNTEEGKTLVEVTPLGKEHILKHARAPWRSESGNAKGYQWNIEEEYFRKLYDDKISAEELDK